MKESFGYKTKKKSVATEYLQKLVNRIEKFHDKSLVKKESAYDFSTNAVVLNRSKHIAAKPHKCSVCQGKINIGDVHHRIVFKDKDKFKCNRYHGNCNMHEDAPTNSMGASSSSSGPIQSYDPLLMARKKMMKRFNNFLHGVLKSKR